MSVLKWQVNSSSNFASFFIVMIFSTSVNIKLMHFLLWTKKPHQSPNFDTSVFWWKFAKFLMSFSKPQVNFSSNLHHSSLPWKITPLYFFRSNIKYFAQQEPIKVQIYETFEYLGQNSPNSCHFWNNKSVCFFKICIALQRHET